MMYMYMKSIIMRSLMKHNKYMAIKHLRRSLKTCMSNMDVNLKLFILFLYIFFCRRILCCASQVHCSNFFNGHPSRMPQWLSAASICSFLPRSVQLAVAAVLQAVGVQAWSDDFHLWRGCRRSGYPRPGFLKKQVRSTGSHNKTRQAYLKSGLEGMLDGVFSHSQ